MDMAFFHRAGQMPAKEEPARLDHAMLLAVLAARSGLAESARAELKAVAAAEEPLVELLLAGPRWRGAIAAQRGCFSRAEAGRRLNAP